MIYLLIGIAGMLGAIFRYLIGLLFYTHAVFPFDANPDKLFTKPENSRTQAFLSKVV
ncbi:hypothetical protein [Ureibacillus sp. FSL K6-0786]|uniref:hypothetical protein n=1 Tax=Ureibacillus sp. FSL K6-0786 TaxID=2954607 RepID=UPI0030DDB83D